MSQMSNSPINGRTHPTMQVSERDETLLATRPWLRHYEQGVPAHITIPDVPLTRILEDTAYKYPNRTAILYYGTTITYARLLDYARRFSSALQRLGVKKGDRVAIALPNIPQYPIAFFGALYAGAVAVPTNPLYKERELHYQLADAEASVLVMLDTFYPPVRRIRQQTALQHIIVTSPADFMSLVPHMLYPLEQRFVRTPEPHLSHRELLEDPTLHVMGILLRSQAGDEMRASHADVSVEASNLAVLQYTGGTTGISKGAMLTHHNLLANALQTRVWFREVRDNEEVMLCVAPFFHAYGMTTGMNFSILTATTMVLLPRFKVKEVLKALQHHRVTLFPGIPTMYRALLREATSHPASLGSLRYCISGAAPLAARVQSDFESITHGKLVEGYGLSEAGPVTHCNPLTEECRNGSIGLPLPDVEACIVNQETGEPVPLGEVGELVVKGPNIMQGYWRRRTETQGVFRDGWMRTGDLGKMDEEGYFSIVERVKDVIIASGFKVYPREVEEVLFQHPAVAEASVVGAPDAYRGETVAAFVVLKPGVEASDKTRQELLRHCAQQLTAYKVPTILFFRESLPESLIGKVLRKELRAELST